MAKKNNATVDRAKEAAAQERAGAEADALIALADERKAAAIGPDGAPVGVEAVCAPSEQELHDMEEVRAGERDKALGINGDSPVKRKPVISIMGTDKSTGERVMLHRARSKRAARKWAFGCSFMLMRLYDDLTVAVTREEALL